MKKFKTKMAEVLEVEILEINAELNSFDSWDSLTILSIIALISEEYDVELNQKQIENSKTLKGLQDLIKSKRGF
ncbi:acyl carrier protein [Winogradskyella sp.]|uniref:acyl carrier protein n=1 Tax=uncultured Winogradskyella sp. TaxID=395353 RepID=UPI00236FBB20|nr:acyl carrier protein [Winogradskyella sp.]MDC1504128.1 acyl carrier protein [Winogradskyella sp.]|tara:strand:- start:5580 stop:5801 length:222 start_codon:yes stop_codon:yes gene_type:complete